MVPSLPPVNFHIHATNLPVLGSHWPQASLVSGPGTPPAAGRIDGEKEDGPEGEFDRAVASTKGWLEKRKRSEVENIVALANTDLRAGDEWLVYISPAMKKRLARKLY